MQFILTQETQTSLQLVACINLSAMQTTATKTPTTGVVSNWREESWVFDPNEAIAHRSSAHIPARTLQLMIQSPEGQQNTYFSSHTPANIIDCGEEPLS